MKSKTKLIIGSSLGAVQLIGGGALLFYSTDYHTLNPNPVVNEYVHNRQGLDITNRYKERISVQKPEDINKLSDGQIKISLEKIAEEYDNIKISLDKQISSCELRINELSETKEVKSYERKMTWFTSLGFFLIYTGFSQSWWLAYHVLKKN